MVALVVLSACTAPETDAGFNPADALSTGLSLFNQAPDDLLPVLVETMLFDTEVDRAGETFFVTQREGVAVWAARAPEGKVCILYEFVTERGGALVGSGGGTCELVEQALLDVGGAVIFAGAGSELLAIGLAVDGYDEVWTGRGARIPIENNGFVVALLPSDESWDGTVLQFDNFALVGPGDEHLPADQLARPRSGLLH